MFKVIGCITTAHDVRLVALAAAVCVLTVSITFYLYDRLPKGRTTSRRAWLAVVGLITGSGVWGVHFISMLAFEPALRMGYEPLITFLSLLIAIPFSGFGFSVAAPDADGRRRVAAGGALVGTGVAVMHFTGMAALRLQGRLSWDLAYVAAAIGLSIAFSIAALAVGRPGGGRLRRLAGGGLLILGICGLHFTAMAALVVRPDPRVSVPPEIISRPVLAGAVSALTCIVLLVSFGMVVVDLRLRRRTFTKLRQAIDAMADGMTISDADHRLVIWNARYAELTGVDEAKLYEGMPYGEILGLIADRSLKLDPAERAAWVAERLELRRAGLSDTEVQMRAGLWLRIKNRPTPGGGMVTACVDITDLKRNAQTLARALREADAASRAKTEFLANITHEIRTPLNGVLGMAQVMALGELSPAQSQRLEVIKQSGEDLLAILNDVLDVTRIEAGKLELEQGEIDAAQLGGELEAGFAAAAAAKPAVRFNVVLAPGVAGPRHGDPVRVKQILDVLVSNALKFTASGEVEVRLVQLGAVDEGLEVTVRDTGVGIPPEVLPQLFEKFTQADGASTRRFGGAGLGLAIARPLAMMMGGRITVESVMDQGTTFTLTLPAPRILPVTETFALDAMSA
ncbi:MAG: PAS-domain containing protein [Caulobacteraceae bacterium]|nr:PAS-domain containing protein [Caulobacteraceae bacterium]